MQNTGTRTLNTKSDNTTSDNANSDNTKYWNYHWILKSEYCILNQRILNLQNTESGNTKYWKMITTY